MARILVYAWEVGAAALLSECVPGLLGLGHTCVVTGVGRALDCFRERCSQGVDVCSFMPTMVDGFDVCLSGYGNPSNGEGLHVWEMVAGVLPTVVLLDQWKGLDRFFDGEGNCRTPFPTKICVPTASVANVLNTLGVPGEDIALMGNAILNRCVRGDLFDGLPQAVEIRSRLGIPLDKKVYVLASEGVHSNGHACWQPCDDSCESLFFIESQRQPLWRRIIDECSDQDVVFILRPHPATEAPADSGILIVDWERAEDRELLAVANRVYGISSMLMLQAAALGIGTVSLQSHLENWSPASSFLIDQVWDDMNKAGLFDSVRAAGLHIVSFDEMLATIVDQLYNAMSSTGGDNRGL